MSQSDFVIDNGSGAVVRADINSAFAAAVSLSSGPTPPSVTYPNQWWFDETTNLLKQRDLANTLWVTVASKVGSVWIPYNDGDPIEKDPALIGEVRLWSTTTPPANWYSCDGSEFDRTTFADLFAVIGTIWGVGNGTTTFNIPDFRARMILGRGQGNTAEGGGLGTDRALADLGGAETHTQTPGELATHRHPPLAGTQYQMNQGGNQFLSSDGGPSQPVLVNETGDAGNSDPMDVMNPFAVAVYMIYAGA